MRRLSIILICAVIVAGCVPAYSPPELTATAEHATPTALPTDWPTQEITVIPTEPFITNTPFPYWDRSCTTLPAINQNACMIQKPGTQEPYLNAVVIVPNSGDDWPNNLTTVTYEGGYPKIDAVSIHGGFSGTVSFFFDRPGTQWPITAGECNAVNIKIIADFIGVDVESMAPELSMELYAYLDNGEVVPLGERDFLQGVGSTKTLSGVRLMHWVFYTLSSDRAIDEFELMYRANQPVTATGSDIVINWVVFHEEDVPFSACGNQGPSW